MAHDTNPLFSIGHSNHELPVFRDLLLKAQIQVVADVRTQPASRWVPQYNKEALAEFLSGIGVKYLFLGRELGGRPDNPDYYDSEGHVLYNLVALEPRFLEGLERLERGRREFRIALMCSEENPAVCHRHLLVGRVLSGRGVPLLHIRGDGTLQSDDEVRRSEGKKIEVYQPTLFGEVDDRPWRSLRPLAAKGLGLSEEDEVSAEW
ncbi:MAG: DUF488 domain-containing protein [Planctomycetes bacterium]|nr:DUF488 domain-containing protein [Planctomycetota bacterium]